MPNLHRPDLNKMLSQSVGMLNDFNAYLNAEIEKGTAPNKINPNLILSLEDLLTNTRVELQKQIDGDRVVKIEPHLIRALDLAINKLANKQTEDKVNAVLYVIQGSNIPFLQTLKDMQNLLQTIEGLKAQRGNRTASVEDMDEL